MTYRSIWREAVQCNTRMCLDPRSSDEAFRGLLKRFPDDGMVLLLEG
jgi:hypothetical protein